MEKFGDKISSTCFKWSSLNAPGTETPVSHPVWVNFLFCVPFIGSARSHIEVSRFEFELRVYGNVAYDETDVVYDEIDDETQNSQKAVPSRLESTIWESATANRYFAGLILKYSVHITLTVAFSVALGHSQTKRKSAT